MHMHLTNVVRLKGTKYNIRTVICWTLQRSAPPHFTLKTRGALRPRFSEWGGSCPPPAPLVLTALLVDTERADYQGHNY